LTEETSLKRHCATAFELSIQFATYKLLGNLNLDVLPNQSNDAIVELHSISGISPIMRAIPGTTVEKRIEECCSDMELRDSSLAAASILRDLTTEPNVAGNH
jgi:hypothetical protein